MNGRGISSYNGIVKGVRNTQLRTDLPLKGGACCLRSSSVQISDYRIQLLVC